MKLLDIPNTVEKAAANIAGLGLDYLTVHGTDRKTLDAAVKGRGSSKLKLLAVTVLTSLEQTDLAEQGITGMSPAELVVHRATARQGRGLRWRHRVGPGSRSSCAQRSGRISSSSRPAFASPMAPTATRPAS